MSEFRFTLSGDPAFQCANVYGVPSVHVKLSVDTLFRPIHAFVRFISNIIASNKAAQIHLNKLNGRYVISPKISRHSSRP